MKGEGRGIRSEVVALPVQKREIISVAHRNKEAQKIFQQPFEERTAAFRSKADVAKKRIADNPKTKKTKRELALELNELQNAMNSVRDQLQKITLQLRLLEKQQKHLQERRSQDGVFTKFLQRAIPALDGNGNDLALLQKQTNELRSRKAEFDGELQEYQIDQEKCSNLLTQLGTQQLKAIQREDTSIEKIIDIAQKRREKSLTNR